MSLIEDIYSRFSDKLCLISPLFSRLFLIENDICNFETNGVIIRNEVMEIIIITIGTSDRMICKISFCQGLIYSLCISSKVTIVIINTGTRELPANEMMTGDRVIEITVIFIIEIIL